MHKTRIVGVLVVKNNWVVQSIGFKRYLPVGHLGVAVEYLNQWGIDEIIVLDIDATSLGRAPNFELIGSVSSLLQTPLCVGGGVTTVENMESLLRAGADKIVLNTQILQNPKLLKAGADYFGSQCMIASIDAVKSGETHHVYNRNMEIQSKSVVELARLAEENGAGEIFLNSVDRDGAKCGYDLELAKSVHDSVGIPIILCGGAGKASHLVEGENAGMSALAASNFFHFNEMSVISAKQFMVKNGCNVRLDSYATYESSAFDKDTCRPTCMAEDALERLRFQYSPEEII